MLTTASRLVAICDGVGIGHCSSHWHSADESLRRRAISHHDISYMRIARRERIISIRHLASRRDDMRGAIDGCHKARHRAASIDVQPAIEQSKPSLAAQCPAGSAPHTHRSSARTTCILIVHTSTATVTLLRSCHMPVMSLSSDNPHTVVTVQPWAVATGRQWARAQ